MRKNHRQSAKSMIAALCIVSMAFSVLMFAGLLFKPAVAAEHADDQYVLSLAPTLEPTLAPLSSPTPVVETEAPAFAAVREPESFSYLPVLHRAASEKKQIAITVDDCYQKSNLEKIVGFAEENGGRLTLFPIGENVVRKGMPELLRDCVFRLGFEIENHTWSHARIFRLSEEEMAAEIWKQQAAVSAALGVNYQQHFFRLMGGDGENDQRTHSYLKQLDYLGIADWSLSGSDAEVSQIADSLAPGKIYLFHTTDADTEKLRWFIPYAASQGYELVTLNELFGYDANAMSDLSTAAQEMPAPAPYRVEYRELQQGDYSWSVVRLQKRLMEMGYLDGSAKTATRGNPADGVYGGSTAAAIQSFQRAHGLPETGVADVETQRLLLGDAV